MSATTHIRHYRTSNPACPGSGLLRDRWERPYVIKQLANALFYGLGSTQTLNSRIGDTDNGLAQEAVGLPTSGSGVDPLDNVSELSESDIPTFFPYWIVRP